MIHFLIHNGIGQNITAGVLIAVPGFVWAHRKFAKLHRHLKTHLNTVCSSYTGAPEWNWPDREAANKFNDE